jgi:DNA-binding response OmpR family regulator
MGTQHRSAGGEEMELDVFHPSVMPSDGAPVVLVADDDDAVRELLVRALGAKYTVYEARDGAEARRILEAIPTPDAFVCDVTMPELDGVELLQSIRKDTTLRTPPVLFLSGKSGPLDVVRGINAGARHYVTKPFKIADVLAKIDAMMSKR